MMVEFTDEDEQPIANALVLVARALRDLGNADAATPMGGMEALGKVIEDGIARLAGTHEEGVRTLVEGFEDLGIFSGCALIAQALDRLTEAIRER